MAILSIIIPVWNNWNFTKNCLMYFQKHQSEMFQVIIIDNGSTDDTFEGISLFKKSMNNLIYIRNDQNNGFAAAVNRGFSVASSSQILFLNNDIMFSTSNSDWIFNLIEEIKSHGDCLLGPTAGYVDEQFNFKYETNDPNKTINYMSGWFLAGSYDTFKKLVLPYQDGPFDSNFFAYFEDTDLSFRAKKQGIRFVLYGVPIYHIGKQTSKKLDTNKLYIESKNKFIKKWT